MWFKNLFKKKEEGHPEKDDIYDVVIIGGGIVGSCIARELSRYRVKACVVDKAEDVCCGTTKANSAICHAGFDAKEGTLMAKLNVEGNRMMGDLAEELDFAFTRNGSLVVCRSEEDLPNLEALLERGIKNGVEELRIVYRDELVKMEPNIADDVIAALYAPTAGILCPFTINFAFAENAYVNGVAFNFLTEVTDIKKEGQIWVLTTSKGIYKTKCVVNAAGVYSDKMHNMVSEKKLHITPRRGDYLVLDKTEGQYVKHTIFALPSKLGKGVLVTPTIHGNLMIGPTAIDIDDKEATNTTQDGLDQVINKASETVKNVPVRTVIASFAGLRAHEDGHEFVIGEVEDAKGFVDAAGIESPGLTSAPAIGVMVSNIVKDILNLEKKDNFIARRKGVQRTASLPPSELNELIKKNPAYGTIVCRCEMITEGEIIDALTRPLGASTLDGVKRRTRASTGRCQGGFCYPRIMEIMAREKNMDIMDIKKSGASSFVTVGKAKESGRGV